jgi:hypothetical protein
MRIFPEELFPHLSLSLVFLVAHLMSSSHLQLETLPFGPLDSQSYLLFFFELRKYHTTSTHVPETLLSHHGCQRSKEASA